MVYAVVVVGIFAVIVSLSLTWCHLLLWFLKASFTSRSAFVLTVWNNIQSDTQTIERTQTTQVHHVTRPYTKRPVMSNKISMNIMELCKPVVYDKACESKPYQFRYVLRLE